MSVLTNRTVCRCVGWLVIVAMLLPTLIGCATVHPRFIRLDGIVINATRVAGPDIAGAVRITRGGSYLEGKPNMELLIGDRIETAANAEAVIRFPSGSMLLMRPGSSGRIGSLIDAIGEFFVSVRGAFTVDTQFVKAGAQGTAYLVRTEPGEITRVTVFEGRVAIDSPRGAWPPFTATRGMTVTAGRQAPQAAPASEAELMRTRDWVERLQKQVPPEIGLSGPGIAAILIGAIVGAILIDRAHDARPPRQYPLPPQPVPAPTPAAPAPGAGTINVK